jgi:hypothetical protein
VAVAVVAEVSATGLIDMIEPFTCVDHRQGISSLVASLLI